MGGEVKKNMLLVAKERLDELTWEKLLKRAPVSVLLVERDDSTSQIITALLRKCGYRVTVASDGLNAWVILREKDHNIDLVLTEVELPKMSGVTLLTMMLAHENCKHIPVIMMSSNDSISIAFKCMIRGASDFLVKPIRKNELINIWQHVWRKQKSENHAIKKNLDLYYDYHSVDKEIDKQDDKACSEKESDAQSSCTRSDLEDESTCTLQKKMQLKEEKHEKFVLFDESKNPEKLCDEQLDGMLLFPKVEANGFVSIRSDIQPEVFDPIEHQHISISDNCRDESTDKLIVDLDSEKETSSMPSLQLSLKSYPHIISSRKDNESNTLHHSNFSAFSLYNNSSKVVPTFSKQSNFQAQNRGSCSNYIEPESPLQFPVKPLHYGHGLKFNTGDTDLIDSALHPTQEGTTFRCTPIRFVPFPVPGISFDAAGPNPFSQQPTFYPLPAQPPWSSSHQTFIESFSHQSGFINDFNHPEDYSFKSQAIQNHHQHSHPEDAELADEQRLVSSITGDNASVCNISKSRPVTNTLDISEASARSGDQDGFQTHGLMNSTDANRLNQREAALTKFRLKRKERCFEKKVRYLSRKKLAEQRPRVKGQFVRQP